MKRDLKLLDCTLRDGGYVNAWRWGFSRARAIVRALVHAGVDVVEVGFLRDAPCYDPDVTACARIEELNALLPAEAARARREGHAMFAAMAMHGGYDASKLRPYAGEGIELIRVTAHDYDLRQGLELARSIQGKGYKLSFNPINIMGYTDEELLWILRQVDALRPWQFSIVDTFGSMRRRDLERVARLADNNLNRSVRLALHLHENMGLSACLAQDFVEMGLERPIAVDASLMGVGRAPGNLPVELIADYLNERAGGAYDIDPMMDAIEEYVLPMKGDARWGYTPAYFLSARFNLHRNYAEHYLAKGDLTNRDINHLLARIDRAKSTAFDAGYADALYEEYRRKRVDDAEDRARLARRLRGREALVVAPGPSVAARAGEIRRFIEKERPAVISVNFVPRNLPVDFAFFGNARRRAAAEAANCEVIVSSNLPREGADYAFDYNRLCGAFAQGNNSLILLLALLKQLGLPRVNLAGADGYAISGENYCDASLRAHAPRGAQFNEAVARALEGLGLPLRFLTPSAYARD